MPTTRTRFNRRATAGAAARCRALAALALAAALAAAGTPASAAAVAPPTQQQVFQELGVDTVPAAYVVLVDTSGSMQTGGLYAKVASALPGFIRALSPQDLLAVYTFDSAATPVAAPLAAPNPGAAAALPAQADGQWTDFGVALNQALSELEHAPASVHDGGIVLLTDGVIDAPNDADYKTLASPGWAKLHSVAQDLSARMSLTGYGIRVGDAAKAAPGTCPGSTTDPATCAGVGTVLGALLPPDRVEVLPNDIGDISALLDRTKDDARIAKAVHELQPDIGKGVTAVVSAPKGTDLAALDFGSGSVPVTVTLTSNAARVGVVSVTGLAATVRGFPATLTGLPAEVDLKPLTPVPLPARLVWKPPHGSGATGGSVTVHGTVQLTGQVSSPWSTVIRTGFGDTAFRLGGLDGGAAGFGGVYQQSVDPLPWVLLAVVALLVLAAGLWWGNRRFPRLRGELLIVDLAAENGDAAEPGTGEHTITLHGRRMKKRLDSLVGVSGTVRIGAVRAGGLRIAVVRDADREHPARVRAGVTREGKLIRASIGFRHLL